MNWFYTVRGQKVGPVPEQELKLQIEARVVDGKTLVWREGMQEWKPLLMVPELVSLLPAETSKSPLPPIASPGNQGPKRKLNIDQLRDSKEMTALTFLYVLAIPAFLVVLAWLIASRGGVLVFFGLVWLGLRMAEYFFAAYIKTNGIRVSERQLPDVYWSVVQCSTALELSPPEVYVMQHNIWNAFAAKLAGRRLVVLYSGAIDSILLHGDLQQLTWLVGHEIGHHAAGHLSWQRSLARFGAWAPWFYLWYSRRCELTCDRVGLYCVDNRKASLLAVANLAAGAQLAGKVNVSAAIEEWEAVRGEFFVKYRTMYSTHPPVLWRMQALTQAAGELGIN